MTLLSIHDSRVSPLSPDQYERNIDQLNNQICLLATVAMSLTSYLYNWGTYLNILQPEETVEDAGKWFFSSFLPMASPFSAQTSSDESADQRAVKYVNEGKLEEMKKMIRDHEKFDLPRCIVLAASRGDLKILQWLTPFTRWRGHDAALAAVESKDNKVIDWMALEGYNFAHEAVLSRSVELSQLDGVKHFISSGGKVPLDKYRWLRDRSKGDVRKVMIELRTTLVK